jgi:hypothetical protein
MEENLTPCGKLKNLLKKPQPDIKSTIINNLRPNINVNPNGEKAAYLQKLPNGTMGTTVSYPTTFGQIGIKTGSNFYSAIHTHPKNRQPMFSWSDIYVLYKMNLNLEQHNAGLASFLLVCEDDNGDFQTYAISFDSIGNSIENVLNDPQYAGMSHLDIVKIMDKKLYDKYVKEENSGFTPNYEKAFLKFLDGNNISLYKANESLTEWSKLNLNEEPNTSTVVPTPCN